MPMFRWDGRRWFEHLHAWQVRLHPRVLHEQSRRASCRCLPLLQLLELLGPRLDFSAPADALAHRSCRFELVLELATADCLRGRHQPPIGFLRPNERGFLESIERGLGLSLSGLATLCRAAAASASSAAHPSRHAHPLRLSSAVRLRTVREAFAASGPPLGHAELSTGVERPVFVAIHEPEPQKHPFAGPSHSFH